MSLGRVSRLLKGSLSWSALRPVVSGQGRVVSGQRRELSHVPVDDLISGLNEEQIQVTWQHESCALYQGAWTTASH